jgi:hypothetical protein
MTKEKLKAYCNEMKGTKSMQSYPTRILRWLKVKKMIKH